MALQKKKKKPTIIVSGTEYGGQPSNCYECDEWKFSFSRYIRTPQKRGCQKSKQKPCFRVPQKDHRKGKDLHRCVASSFLTVSVPAYSHLFIWSCFKVNMQTGFHATLRAVLEVISCHLR